MRTVGLTFPTAEERQEAEKLVCPHCGKEYKSAEALAKHIKDKHPDAPPVPPTGGDGDTDLD